MVKVSNELCDYLNSYDSDMGIIKSLKYVSKSSLLLYIVI